MAQPGCVVDQGPGHPADRVPSEPERGGGGPVARRGQGFFPVPGQQGIRRAGQNPLLLAVEGVDVAQVFGNAVSKSPESC